MVAKDYVANTLMHDIAFNANYDIVWSFSFNLSGSSNKQGAFVTFLQDSRVPFVSAGGVGIDTGFTGGACFIGIEGSCDQYLATEGLSALVTPDNSFTPISGAYMGCIFDTTGCAALATTYRDGLSAPLPNSVTIRGWDSKLTYTRQVSEFNFINNTDQWHTLRFRLGNLGRNLYVDWHGENNFTFVTIASAPVAHNCFPIEDDTKFKVGIIYTSPISANSVDAIAKFRINEFQVEGIEQTPTYTYNYPQDLVYSESFILPLSNIGATPIDFEVCANLPRRTSTTTIAPVITTSVVNTTTCAGSAFPLSSFDSAQINQDIELIQLSVYNEDGTILNQQDAYNIL